MSYADIFILGWGFNIMMLIVSFVLALKLVGSIDPASAMKEQSILIELKQEYDQLYPYKNFEILCTYFVPFMAFYRNLFKLIEMNLFFAKNKNTTLFDFMVYKYEKDIRLAKQKIK